MAMDSGAAGHPSIDFDVDKHRYSVDGQHMPSVTQILQEAGLVDTTWFTTEGRSRGTYVALMTEAYDMGTLQNPRVHPEMRAYLDAWIAFRGAMKFDIVERERARYQPRMKYCGTPDLVGTYFGEWAIIDIKTGGKLPHYPIQTSGYQGFWAGRIGKKPRRFCLYLKKNGTFKLQEHTNDQDDWQIFCSCVQLWHWKKENLN
jgi:hypothetical protein